MLFLQRTHHSGKHRIHRQAESKKQAEVSEIAHNNQ
jgi:hypothetical protein